MGVTWAIAIPVGALTGALVGMMPPPHKLFDDGHSIMHIVYGDTNHIHNEDHDYDEKLPDLTLRVGTDG